MVMTTKCATYNRHREICNSHLFIHEARHMSWNKHYLGLKVRCFLKETLYGLLYLAVTMACYIRMVFETRCYPFKTKRVSLTFLAKKLMSFIYKERLLVACWERTALWTSQVRSFCLSVLWLIPLISDRQPIWSLSLSCTTHQTLCTLLQHHRKLNMFNYFFSIKTETCISSVWQCISRTHSCEGHS
jgi:hypothetical protein